jgi:glutamyl-tRNA synthetase
MKLDGDSKMKLSKRKDPEAAVSYYNEVGYPVQSVIEYLLNIINSGFEAWRTENPQVDSSSFEIALDKMSKSGALFDLVKLNDVSKDRIAAMKADDVYANYIAWAKEYDSEMYELVTSNEAMAKEIFNIDKEGPKPRKDYAKWDEVKEKVFYFFDELFDKAFDLLNVELLKHDKIKVQTIEEDIPIPCKVKITKILNSSAPSKLNSFIGKEGHIIYSPIIKDNIKRVIR